MRNTSPVIDRIDLSSGALAPDLPLLAYPQSRSLAGRTNNARPWPGTRPSSLTSPSVRFLDTQSGSIRTFDDVGQGGSLEYVRRRVSHV